MKINNLDDFITPKQAFGKIPDVADMSGYDSPNREDCNCQCCSRQA